MVPMTSMEMFYVHGIHHVTLSALAFWHHRKVKQAREENPLVYMGIWWRQMVSLVDPSGSEVNIVVKARKVAHYGGWKKS